MPGTPAQIRQAADDALATLWAAIQNRQDTYFAANGRYWQGLKTASVTPADGASSVPDIGTATPPDLAGLPWPAAIRSANLPCSIECHRYQTPRDGWGYVAIVEVTINGNTWRRAAVPAGLPEQWRTFGWTQVAP